MTMLGWRRRYGFLGGTEEGSQGGYQHSLIEALVAVTIAAMIRRGVDPKDAVKADDFNLAAMFDGIVSGEITTTVFGFHAKGRDADIEASLYFWGRDQTLGEILDKTPGGGVMIIDLQRIVDHVLKALNLTIKRTAPL
jgi:hypothetical protein